ncbi:hypothetical protein A9264_07210 [Vibrio sp. UCD-FRSSP16_10]|nr:hypothetical protein A9264_07210 [Vibrio sp. UCD-FRSSP16_10]OBT17956.1 hypothetical protein A9260_01200 [Vibrio sp. UCD-FRSSP16_30]
MMNSAEQQHFNPLYEQHLSNLKLQGKRPATVDAYSRAVRWMNHYADRLSVRFSHKSHDLIKLHITHDKL